MSTMAMLQQWRMDKLCDYAIAAVDVQSTYHGVHRERRAALATICRKLSQTRWKYLTVVDERQNGVPRCMAIHVGMVTRLPQHIRGVPRRTMRCAAKYISIMCR